MTTRRQLLIALGASVLTTSLFSFAQQHGNLRRVGFCWYPALPGSSRTRCRRGHLEMLLGVLPKLTRVAVLLNPANPAESRSLKNLLTAAQKTKIEILNAEARNAREIGKAFLMMAQEGAGAVIVSLDSLFNVQQRRIAELLVTGDKALLTMRRIAETRIVSPRRFASMLGR